ncbi:MAG: hypothetical protein WC748_04150 [Legionellales bacterium]|jgi:hypothetical protein
MANDLLKILINDNNQIKIKEYLETNTLDKITEDDINSALEQLHDDACDISLQDKIKIQELLCRYLVKNDIFLSLPSGNVEELQEQMFKNLFKYALDIKKFPQAKEMLDHYETLGTLINQTTANGNTLLEEAIRNNNDEVFNFLLENNAKINASVNAHNFINHPGKVERLTKFGANFIDLMKKNPELLFTAIQDASIYPNRFQKAITATPNLLINKPRNHYNNENSNINIFEHLVSTQQWPLLTLVLQHVKNVVIQQQKFIRCLDIQNPVSENQIINCVEVLDCCIKISQSKDANIQKAFKDAELSFEYKDIQNTKTDEFYFNQGLLRFLKLYHPNEALPDLAQITYPEHVQTFLKAEALEKYTEQEHAILETTSYGILPIAAAFRLKSKIEITENQYKNMTRIPFLKEQQRQQEEHAKNILALHERREKEQQEQQIELDLIAARTANVLAHNLPDLFNRLLTVMLNVAEFTNSRDQKKQKLNKLNRYISTPTLLATYVYAMMGAVNSEHEKQQGFPNAKNAGIGLLIYYIEAIIAGIVNTQFVHTPGNKSDRMLAFNQLPTRLQTEITDLMTLLDPLQLKVDIEPGCKVDEVINLLHQSASLSFNRLQSALPNTEHPLPSYPNLIKYTWNEQQFFDSKDGHQLFLHWLVALCIHLVILIALWLGFDEPPADMLLYTPIPTISLIINYYIYNKVENASLYAADTVSETVLHLRNRANHRQQPDNNYELLELGPTNSSPTSTI